MRLGSRNPGSGGDIAESTQHTTEANKSYQEQKTALESQYNKLLSQVPNSSKDDLIRAQKAWTTFRDLECAFQSFGMEGGSIQPSVRLACLEDLTRQRIGQIKAQLDCEEGDLSCVWRTAE